jgi:hypothetical protein
VFTAALLWTVQVFGQGSCHNNGGYPGQGGYPNAGDQGYPYDEGGNYNYGEVGQQIPAPAPLPYLTTQPAARPMSIAQVAPVQAAQVHAAVQTAPKAPTAKITLVSATSTDSMQAIAAAPSGKLRIVADEPDAIDSRIVGLVGTWKAVARQGDGELTTVELRMDNRGWAELTVPGDDGKPSTKKSRVKLENEELKLVNLDQIVTLGKLVDFDSRQMVLERAEGQVTFVRL